MPPEILVDNQMGPPIEIKAHEFEHKQLQIFEPYIPDGQVVKNMIFYQLELVFLIGKEGE